MYHKVRVHASPSTQYRPFVPMCFIPSALSLSIILDWPTPDLYAAKYRLVIWSVSPILLGIAISGRDRDYLLGS